MVAPSGEQYEISDGGYRAVVTECGAGLRLLEYDGRPLVAGYSEQEHSPAGRGQLLAPWPNRIQDGSYTFGGEELQLPVDEVPRNNAIHGLVRWATWSVSEHTDTSVSLGYRLMAQPGYPWTLDLRVRYDVSSAGLRVTVDAVNLSRSPAPYALGAHPYLTAGDDGVDGWELTLPAATRVLTDERLLPIGRESVAGTSYDFRAPRAIGAVSFDDAFTGLERTAEGNAEVHLRNPQTGAGVKLWMDEAHGWIQVFSSDELPDDAWRRSLAVEPMTAQAEAFRTGEDLIELGAAGSGDDRHSASWGISTA